MQTLRVRRLYDDKNNTLLYVAYSTRLDGSKNVSVIWLSLCAQLTTLLGSLDVAHCTHGCWYRCCSTCLGLLQQDLPQSWQFLVFCRLSIMLLASKYIIGIGMIDADYWQQIQDIHMCLAGGSICVSSSKCSSCRLSRCHEVITK